MYQDDRPFIWKVTGVLMLLREREDKAGWIRVLTERVVEMGPHDIYLHPEVFGLYLYQE